MDQPSPLARPWQRARAAAEALALQPPPIAQLLGFTFSTDDAGALVIALDVTERLANPMGTLHGGVLCDLADLAMGAAYGQSLEPDESFTTLELKINFLKPVWRGRVRATAHVVKKGRTIGLVECDVLDERDQLVARASCTCLTLRGDQAQGR